MAKIEVDEGEYNAMVALRTVAQKIAAKPESRKLLEQAHKLVDEKAATPTLDAEERQLAPINELTKKFTDEINALKTEREEEKKQRTLTAIAEKQTKDLAALRSRGFLDEGIKKVEEIMTAKGLTDVEDAVAIFEKQNPPPMVVSPGGIGSWGFTDLSNEPDKSIEALIQSKGQNDQVADRMALEALRDFRGQSHR